MNEGTNEDLKENMEDHAIHTPKIFSMRIFFFSNGKWRLLNQLLHPLAIGYVVSYQPSASELRFRHVICIFRLAKFHVRMTIP